MTSSESTCLLSVVVPSYNEGAAVAPLISEAVQTFERAGLRDFELIVVDDGSHTASAQALDDICLLDSRVRLQRHSVNQGLGAALQTGYATARGTFVTFIPADGQVPPSVVVDLMAQLGDWDLITTTRRMDALWHRRVLTSCWRALMIALFRYDPIRAQGIYIARRRLLEGMEFRSTTGLFNFEIVMRCASRTSRVRCGETIVRPRLSGSSKVANLRTIALTLRETVLLRLRW